MKLVMFSVNMSYPQVERLGVQTGDGVIDLAASYRAMLLERELCDKNRVFQVADLYFPSNMTWFLEGGHASMEAAKKAFEFADSCQEAVLRGEKLTYAADEVRLHAPITTPPTIRDFLCFEEHYKNALQVSELPAVWYEMPIYYKSVASTIIGPNETCVWPDYSDVMDYELEFACVIGKRGKDISVEDAGDYIAGYTIFNDFSARDQQLKEMDGKLGPAKGKDFCTAVGPSLVTPDEISDVYNLNMTATVNGEQWSAGNTKTMYWTFEEIIAYVSQSEELVPGDILGSGTVGTGCGLELGKYLQTDDVVELAVDSLGTLRNTVR